MCFKTGTTYKLKSNFTPSLTLENHEQARYCKCKERTDSSSANGYQPQEESLTMPQLKRMRQASMSIIRRTGRTNQNADRKFSTCNPGFELSDDLQRNDSANFETYVSEENKEDSSKRPSEITCKINASPTATASVPSLGCLSDKRQQLRPVTLSSLSVTDSLYQARLKGRTSDDIYQQRESFVLETQVSRDSRDGTETTLNSRIQVKTFKQILVSIYMSLRRS